MYYISDYYLNIIDHQYFHNEAVNLLLVYVIMVAFESMRCLRNVFIKKVVTTDVRMPGCRQFETMVVCTHIFVIIIFCFAILLYLALSSLL